MSERDDYKALMDIMHKMKRLQHRKLDAGSMNRGEFSMLMHISHAEKEGGGAVTVSQLAELQETSMPAISQMLNNLEKKGMIERHPGEQDRRIVYIHITPEGKKILDCAFQEFTQTIRYVVERLGEEDTRKLIELFSKLYDIIKDLEEETLKDSQDRERKHV